MRPTSRSGENECTCIAPWIRPALDTAVAWALYTQKERGLANPAEYLIRRLVEGDDPPDDFLKLAQMSWEQWRVCASRDYLETQSRSVVLAEDARHACRFWQKYYGQRWPGDLPCRGWSYGDCHCCSRLEPLLSLSLPAGSACVGDSTAIENRCAAGAALAVSGFLPGTYRPARFAVAPLAH